MKKKSRIIGVAVAVAVVALIAFSGVALAWSPSAEWEWDGSGHFDGSSASGSSVEMSWDGIGDLWAKVGSAGLSTGGSDITGTFSGSNIDRGFASSIDASVNGSGYIFNWQGVPAGEPAEDPVGSGGVTEGFSNQLLVVGSEGTLVASGQWHSDSRGPYRGVNADFAVEGTTYALRQWLGVGGEWASVTAGSPGDPNTGTCTLSSSGSDRLIDSSLNFAPTDHSFDAVGSGFFNMSCGGDTLATLNAWTDMPESNYKSLTFGFDSAFVITDFSMTAD